MASFGRLPCRKEASKASLGEQLRYTREWRDAHELYRIAMVLPRPPWCSGGVERFVHEITKRLAKDFDIKVYCADDDKQNDVQSQDDLTVYKFRGFTKAYYFSPSLYKELKRTKCDLIHSHNFSSFVPLATSLVKRDRKLVFSPYFHIIGSKLIYNMLRKIYDPIVGNYLFRTADAIVSFSCTERHFIRSRFGVPLGKIRVIYHGTSFHETGSALYDVQEKIILYAGRLEKYKNVHVIIESLQYLPKEYKLYIIGRGSYGADLMAFTKKLKLQDRVTFLGYLEDNEMYRWLRTCRVFVQLSEIESGISTSCIDALAAGKPVIVNDNTTSLRETVGLFKEKGVFPFNLSENGSKELAHIIEDAGFFQVNVDLSGFNWDNSARKLKALYNELLSDKD